TPLPRLVLVFDEMETVFNHPAVSLLLEKGKALGVYGIFLTRHSSRVPGECGGVLNARDGKLFYKQSGIDAQECNADLTPRPTIEAFSAALAQIPFPSGGTSSQPPEQVTFLQLFNARRVEDLPVEEWWGGKNPYGYLRAPIGRTSPTSDWIFDLNDRDGAHGPHGLLGGMTGSGKSEALKAIILALAVTHHPYDLNFALVDFKGGAAFNELRDLPHTVGVVTDIESNPTFAERVIQSLTGEIERRKKILENARATFRFGRAHIDEYREKLRTRRPLPRLLIVFDEFAEFKARNPEGSRKLIGIARQGRSLGVHLLLATQNIAAAIDPEIMQNSTYKICLRVSDPQDSVQMIGIPDAVSLKRGRAYFSVSSRVLYQSAFSGADYSPNVEAAVPNSMVRIYPDGRRETVSMLAWKSPEQNKPAAQPATEAAAVVEHLERVAGKMGLKKPAPVWQDALPDRLYLPDLLDRFLTGGWDGGGWLPCHPLSDRTTVIKAASPYLGLFDDPQEQNQPCFQIDPSQGGNLLVFGSAGSGKSTLLRTLVTSLALTHTPEQVHVYVLDYGGQPRLKVLEAYPHVGAVITRMEAERTQRLVSYLSAEVLRRNHVMRMAKVDSWADYNAQAAPEERFPATFLVIDGFINFKDSFEPEMVKAIVMLLSGQSAGIHLAISSYLQSDLPNELYANISNRLSLFQANANEYQGLVGFLSEARLQEDAVLGMRPGRGLLRRTTPLSFQAALPTYGDNDKELAENLSALATAMGEAWKGKRTPPEIQYLEEHIYLPPAPARSNRRDDRAEIGLTYQDLNPIGFSFRQDSNAFLVSSTSPGEGKTTLLQMWMLRLAELYPPEQIEIKIVSFHSQSLIPMQPLPHVQLIKFKPAFEDFLSELNRRVAGRYQEREGQIRADMENFDQQAFLDRQAHIWIVIDDYGKFSASIDDNERAQLIDLLQKGEDVGLSVVISDTLADVPRTFQDSFVGKVVASGCGVLLGGADGIDLFNNARITPGQPTIGLPAGRGYFIRRGRVSLFQTGVWWRQNENPSTALHGRIGQIEG
ncbi:MAG: FtsK/SpoIIIE domain-containing protein, partial [Anaerolineaceae bacterium]|nr:FtsK/SpoIIIE domain-containing protein [Anaerolineaceae bacterium]